MLPSGNKPSRPVGKRAGRKASEYRVRLDDEDRRQLALDLAGLIRPPERRRTFGEVAADWLSRVVRVRRSCEEYCLWNLWPLWELREAGFEELPDDLTKARVEERLNELDKANGGTLGPSSLNKLISAGKLAVDDAIANRCWRSVNPFMLVTRRRVVKAPWVHITADELSRALAHLSPQRQREFLWQIHVGTRPGEMRGLRRVDVDLARGYVTIRRSNARNQTKTGVPRTIPIPGGARAALEEAMRLSTSELVFPNPDGSMQRADAKMGKTLRAALKKAGIVTGYRFTCRRKGCGFRDERPEKNLERRCPRCEYKLWCEGIAKHVTFYGLRHAANNLHIESGAEVHAVKTALGHAPRDVNDGHYRHMTDEYFRAELNKLVIKPKKVK